MEEDCYEIIKLGGGLKESSFICSTFYQHHSLTLLAASTSYGDILLVSHSARKFKKNIIPWRLPSTPVAMAFKGHHGNNLLVAGSDGSIVDIPLSILYENGNCSDINYDANVFAPESNRGKPTAIVWWETARLSSIAILGTELGELCFVDLETGREVGGTYIPGIIHRIQLCQDDKNDSYFLLITGPDQCMWYLLLQKEGTRYTFPLDLPCENPESREVQLQDTSFPSRFRGFKEMSVNKLYSFKQRMTGARLVRKKKPTSVSRGVGTDDQETLSPESEAGSASPTHAQKKSHADYHREYLAKPQVYQMMGQEVYASQQPYTKGCYQIAGYSKEDRVLVVHSYNSESDSSQELSCKYYLDNVYPEYVMLSDIIYVSTSNGKALSIVSNYYAELMPEDNPKLEYTLQEIAMGETEVILKLYGCPVFDEFLSKSDSYFDYVGNKRGFVPNACILVTTKNIYVVQMRYFVGALLIDKILKFGNSSSAKMFAKTFKLDSSYFEFAADYQIKKKRVMEAIDLYKYAGVSNLKFCLKLSSSGSIIEFMRYWSNIVNSRFLIDFSDEEKCVISSLGAIAYLYLLVCPAKRSGCKNREAAFNELLKFLTENRHYDKILILTLAANCWRWDVLQYLSSCRGLNLEKLHLLFNGSQSAALSGQLCNKKQLKLILSKVNHEGYSACMINQPMGAVILLKPSLTRKLMAFTTLKIDTMTMSMLGKFALLFDPSNSLLRPFLWSSFAGRHHQLAFDFHSEADEPIFLENIVDIFLSIVVKINELNGWKYDPDLLNVALPENQVNEDPKQTFVKGKILTCGYNFSAVIYNESLFVNGSRSSPVVGNGCNQSIGAQYFKSFDSSIAQQIQSTIKKCSEENFSDELQDDTSNDQHKTVTMKKVEYFNSFRILFVSCGNQHVIAVTDSGIYGWGENSYGQLGIGTRNSSYRPFIINGLSKLGIVHTTCGQYHTLALSQDGRLYAWGWGLHGQLGNGSISDSLKPQLVSTLESIKIVTASAGYSHSIALDVDGTVYAWGCSVYGQIGSGNKNKAVYPVRVSLPSPAYTIATGYFHNLAATEDNRIYSWGEHASCLKSRAHLRKKVRLCMDMDEAGQTSSDTADKTPTVSQSLTDISDGTPNDTKQDNDYHLQPREVFHSSDRIKQISTGATHSMVLTVDGKLFTWGRNINGQIGNASRIEMSVPYHVKPGHTFEDIAAGSDFSLAIEEGGQIWGWGSNLCSQLGIKINKEQENSRPFVLKTAKRLVKLPKTHQTNVLSPLEVTSLSFNTNKMAAVSRKMDASINLALNHIHSPDEDLSNESDSDIYGAKILHNCLVFLYPHYSIKKIEEVLLRCNGHQPLAAIYCKDKQYKKAMHHQLLSISEYAKRCENGLPTNCSSLDGKYEIKCSQDPPSKEDIQDWFIKESSRVLDHYLKLQTQESEAGIKSVLTEGIASWLEFSLPTVQLEKLLLNHMPSAMYPLAMVLFGEDSLNNSFPHSGLPAVEGIKCGLEQLTLKSVKSADEAPSTSNSISEESVADSQSRNFSSNLSKEFCFRMCDSLIGQMEKFKEKGGGTMTELAKPPLDKTQECSNNLVMLGTTSDSNSCVTEKLPEEVIEDTPVVGKLHNSENSGQNTWVFTCGHAFGCKEFKEDILPRLEQTVTSIPDQLGKAARVILDQFHGENVLMACPNCALAHLSIQLSKHVKKEEQNKHAA